MQEIRGESEWWDAFMWDTYATKSSLQPYFHPALPRVSLCQIRSYLAFIDSSFRTSQCLRFSVTKINCCLIRKLGGPTELNFTAFAIK